MSYSCTKFFIISLRRVVSYYHALLAQLVEAMVLGTIQCGFESHGEHEGPSCPQCVHTVSNGERSVIVVIGTITLVMDNSPLAQLAEQPVKPQGREDAAGPNPAWDATLS